MAKSVDPHAILETLKRRRAEIDNEIETVERFIRISRLGIKADSPVREAQGKPQRTGAARKAPARVAVTAPKNCKAIPGASHRSDGVVRGRGDPGAPSRGAVVAAAREIIAAAGAPLDRNALLLELKARGVVVGGKRPLANLQNMLWKSRADIVNLRGHGHWLADREYPPAGYRLGAIPAD